MPYDVRMRYLVGFCLSLLATNTFAAPSLRAPATAPIGADITIVVAYTGAHNPRDFVTIVAQGAPDGSYADYAYITKPGPFKLRAPATAGNFEVRLLAADSPYPTLARSALKLTDVTATLVVPAQVKGGQKLAIRWTGPNNDRDYIGIADTRPGSSPYRTYQYTSGGNPIELVAPDAPGDYEVRYFLAQGDKVIGRQPLRVGATSAQLTAPPKVVAGASFAVRWEGPNNPRDFITIVKAGAAEGTYAEYEYTSAGNPVTLRAPDEAGEYELRYATAQSYLTLASARINVAAVNASVKGPPTAVGGSTVSIAWSGPGNRGDYVTIVAKNAKDGMYDQYEYTARGNPVTVRAPLAAGDYEIRYATGQSNAVLARAPLRLTPPPVEAGFVRVTAAPNATRTGAVEIILDASGSMLQKLGAQRRIDIAKQTLMKLTTAVIPAGTPFALRVFGREVDSCQTALDVPLSPLDAKAVSAKIGALVAKNNARTAIGASLLEVPKDLKAATGERIVIVLTDGEETCEGDPAAAIAALRKAGTSVRVNFVGFAIDEPRIAASFRRWADAGGGLYFDAQNAAALDTALARSLQPAFDLLDGQGKVVASGFVGGDPIRLLPGTYQLRRKGAVSGGVSTVIKSKETAIAQL
jgi:hypothetical protein